MDKDLNPGEIEELKECSNNPELLRLTEKVIQQNNKILEMNARLLVVFSTPMFYVKSKEQDT